MTAISPLLTTISSLSTTIPPSSHPPISPTTLTAHAVSLTIIIRRFTPCSAPRFARRPTAYFAQRCASCHLRQNPKQNHVKFTIPTASILCEPSFETGFDCHTVFGLGHPFRTRPRHQLCNCTPQQLIRSPQQFIRCPQQLIRSLRPQHHYP